LVDLKIVFPILVTVKTQITFEYISLTLVRSRYTKLNLREHRDIKARS